MGATEAETKAPVAQATLRDAGTIYERVRARIVGLVSSLDDPGAIPVPATPGWSVHDLVAHMSGSCADVLSGNISGLASDEWTGAQVRIRRDRPFAEVLSEWAELAPQIAAMVDDFPGRYADNAIADLVVHEHDIRGAIGRPGERESAAVDIGLDFVVTMIVHPGAVALGIGPLGVKAGDRSWTLGASGASGVSFDLEAMRQGVLEGRDARASDTPAATLTAETFELFRAVTGRRSETQIRSYGWSVDPEPFLPIFGLGPFSVRPTPLDE